MKMTARARKNAFKHAKTKSKKRLKKFLNVSKKRCSENRLLLHFLATIFDHCAAVCVFCVTQSPDLRLVIRFCIITTPKTHKKSDKKRGTFEETKRSSLKTPMTASAREKKV